MSPLPTLEEKGEIVISLTYFAIIGTLTQFFSRTAGAEIYFTTSTATLEPEPCATMNPTYLRGKFLPKRNRKYYGNLSNRSVFFPR